MSASSHPPAPVTPIRMSRMRAGLHRFLSHWVVECPAFALLFDLFVREYRLGPLRFEIPARLAPRAFRSRWFLGRYEWFERTLIDRHVPGAAQVLEFGGCLGVVSCYINRRLDQPGRHKVFEANPTLIPVLQRNRELNQCSFTIEHGMISQREAATFYVAESVLDSSMYQAEGTGVTVPAKSIRAVLGENPWADTLIMDIEGAEQDVFLAGDADWSGIQLILLEMHASLIGAAAVTQISARLNELGFQPIDSLGQVEVWRRGQNQSPAAPVK
jgi:FkbM family methyltransferase